MQKPIEYGSEGLRIADKIIVGLIILDQIDKCLLFPALWPNFLQLLLLPNSIKILDMEHLLRQQRIIPQDIFSDGLEWRNIASEGFHTDIGLTIDEG